MKIYEIMSAKEDATCQRDSTHAHALVHILLASYLKLNITCTLGLANLI